eukprot:gene17181-biopygen14384
MDSPPLLRLLSSRNKGRLPHHVPGRGEDDHPRSQTAQAREWTRGVRRRFELQNPPGIPRNPDPPPGARPAPRRAVRQGAALLSNDQGCRILGATS